MHAYAGIHHRERAANLANLEPEIERRCAAAVTAAEAAEALREAMDASAGEGDGGLEVQVQVDGADMEAEAAAAAAAAALGKATGAGCVVVTRGRCSGLLTTYLFAMCIPY